ncbi:MAG: SDR family oxidoreductase [Myxococcales bacterium]|nr:SDR family oxidoreductase [Myxococcales bacterium]
MSDHVLVTGFPRMIARRVALEVLERKPEARVSLLARTKFLEEARTYVDRSPHSRRMAVIEGDCSAIDLGLSGLEWKALAGEITHIQHHAHVSYEGADLAEARALNIGGTREVLELARHAPALRRLVFESTAAVSGDRTGTVFEDELDRGQTFRTEIERTRFVAERLVQRAFDEVPITVLRPGLVVGDSRTGEIDRFDGPYLLVLLVLTAPADLSLPLPARGNAPLNLVPIDYVARASVAVMDEPGAASRALHLVDPAPLHAKRVFELLSSIAGRKMPRGFIPANVTRAVLRAPVLERLLRSPRAFFEQLATDVMYDSRTARDILEPYNIHCPSFDSYADAIVQYVRDRLAEKRSRDEARESTMVEDPLA